MALIHPIEPLEDSVFMFRRNADARITDGQFFVLDMDFYAAANDIVLVILWSLAAVYDVSYVSVVMCFALFLVNDVYGYISWRRMERRQSISQRNVSK